MFKGVAKPGFTIVELVVVLAITGILFIGIVTLLQTQNERSQFAQAVNDMDSTINKYVNDVHSGVDVKAQQYNCTTVLNFTSPPTLNSTGPFNGIGTNDNCLFLGKAIQVNPGLAQANSNQLFIYTVIGNRETQDSGGHNVAITSLAQAKPDVGFASQPATTDTYTIPFGIKVKSSTYVFSPGTPQMSGNSQGDGTDLVGFYNSVDASGGGTQLTRAYDTNASAPNDTKSKLCVEGSGCPTTDFSTFQNWTLCLSDGSITATLSITPTLDGIRSVIKYVSCN